MCVLKKNFRAISHVGEDKHRNEVIFVPDETAKCVSTMRYRVEHNINYMKHKEVY